MYLRIALLCVLCSVSGGLASPVGAEDRAPPRAASPADLDYFEKHVRPVLVEHCFECHSAQRQRGGLRVDGREFLLKGTEAGPALVPGDPERSRLIEVLRYEGDVRMPPKNRLPEEAVAHVTEWVKRGAPWPGTPATTRPTVENVAETASAHWAFQPVQRHPLPEVRVRDWAWNALDRWVQARLEAARLTPSPDAPRQTWLRRVSFDLIGLPPSPTEIEAFLNDPRPDAEAQVVERLLASPRYGERWARHWMDVSRYADTKGYVFREDRNYPQAYLYRAWLIRSLNADLPYDEFLRRQLAADLLPVKDDPQELAAMGFLTLGRRFLNNRHDIIDDRLDVVCRGLMGLTVTCARCHDHKYDPIPMADYYSLYGVFASSEEPKEGPSLLRLVDAAQPFEPVVFLRGSPQNRGPRVPRQFLGLLAGPERKPFQQGSGRLELAEAIARPDNPLTARVLVNRVWAHFFGTPLVKTPSDFGTRSDPPTHPELLDHLAADFVDRGWSLKHLHRTIVLSRTYRQRSDSRAEAAAVDPENRLLWRMNRRRLEFEPLRDACLAVTGRLSAEIGGPSVDLAADPTLPRRTVYAFIDRQNLPGVFRIFDLAGPDTHAPQRFVTTVPQQALYLLNHDFAMRLAETLLERPDLAAEQDPAARIRALYRTVFGRAPDAEELELGLAFVRQAAVPAETPVPAAVWAYGYGAFDSQAQRTSSFTPLPHWTGAEWQGGPQLPDPHLGWCMLRDQGGHPGANPGFAAIRRWTAPRDGNVRVSGRLKHPAAEGDGVRGRLVSSGRGLQGEWTAQHGDTGTRVEELAVAAGETLDFIVDCRESISHDGFHWRVTIEYLGPPGTGEARFDSAAEFAGPRPGPFGPWARYAQVLLLSNEFAFVD